MAAQATTHEIVLSRCQACSTATATQQPEQWELTLLCEEANKAWKDNFLNSAEDTLKNKCDEIWGCIQSLMEATNCFPQASLSLVLQTLHWLPRIPLNLSDRVGIPMMFAYGFKLYELQTWEDTGDGEFHLDNHTWAANRLSHKLACIHGGAGFDRASPSRVA